MSTAKNAIIKAKIEGIITELMIKTDAANVYVDDKTTLATKLSSIITDIASKASTKDLTKGLADKAPATHTHAQSEITGLTDALAKLASSESVTKAIDALRQEMLGDTPVEAYNTFTELAEYISTHKEAADALTAAVGDKADKATTLSGYGITDAYTMTQVDTKISDAISNATGGESAASVKAALDSYKTSNDTRVDALETDKHNHTNKTALDTITSDNITSWTGKSKVYFDATEPASMTDKDLWVQIVS